MRRCVLRRCVRAGWFGRGLGEGPNGKITGEAPTYQLKAQRPQRAAWSDPGAHTNATCAYLRRVRWLGLLRAAARPAAVCRSNGGHGYPGASKMQEGI